MPPLTPSGVTTRFQKQVTNLLRDYEELLLAVHEKRRQASLVTMISEQSVMLTAVLWEAFIHDLFVSYVSADPEQCFRNFKERFNQSNNEKFAGVVRWVSLDFPVAINQLQAEKLLDPKGWNLAVRSAQSLSELANRHLNVVHAKKFSLEADDRDFLDYLVALRNYLSHRSSGARSDFINSVRALKPGGLNAPLSAPIQTVAMHLKQAVPGGTRVNVIGLRAVQVSAKLV